MKSREQTDRSHSFITGIGELLASFRRMLATAFERWVNNDCPGPDACTESEEEPGRWEQATFCSISPDFGPPEGLSYMKPVHRSNSRD